ncbi:MAG: lipopolysaccharide heptosyltransferase family protein, partial [Candidatus Schekmanbacteria bacterium]
VRLGALGDIIHTIPSAYFLRKKFPTSRIDWIVEKRSSELIRGSSLINSIIEIDTKKWRKEILNPASTFSTIREISQIIKLIRKRQYDAAIDFQGLIKSGIITYLSKAKKTIGFNKKHLREPMNFYFIKEHISPDKKDVHIIEKNLSLLKGIGIDSYNVEDFKADLSIFGAESLKEKTLNKYNLKPKEQTIVGIYPGGGWQTKLLETFKYAELIRKICNSNRFEILLIEGKDERELTSKILQNLKNPIQCIRNTSIKELAVVLSYIDILIGPDTGPLHLASILGTPTIGIYGPSSPRRNGPYWGKHKVVYKEFPCSNCYKRKCNDMRCLKEISAEDIYKAFNELVDEV